MKYKNYWPLVGYASLPYDDSSKYIWANFRQQLIEDSTLAMVEFRDLPETPLPFFIRNDIAKANYASS